LERGDFFVLWVSVWVFGKKKKPKTLEFIGFLLVGMEGLSASPSGCLRSAQRSLSAALP
jgi:hypothetical protein